MPLSKIDDRKWHWQSRNPEIKQGSNLNLIGWATILIIRLQASIIYFHAGVEKLKVEEWTNGTAVYYWFTHHYHGAADWLLPTLIQLVSLKLVVFITWGVIFLELLLFAAIFLNPTSERRKLLFWIGIAFHFSVLVIHGLVSFFFSMTAVLTLYLLNHNKDLNISNIKS